MHRLEPPPDHFLINPGSGRDTDNAGMRFRSNSPDVQIGNAGTARTVVQQVAHLARDLLIACVKQHRRGVAHERPGPRSEEHTSELQSLMRISYAVFCLKKKNTNINKTH